MIPWVEIDATAVPGEREVMRLRRRGDEFAIVVGTMKLMDNRTSGSEEALATLTCARLRDPSCAHLLIGGLGMGFTLRAALVTLGPEARLVVAELVPAVAVWARGPLAHVFAGSLDDPRVELRVEDVGYTIKEAPARYDAILLDVDNGPKGLTRTANDGLYSRTGLARARHALRPGGILAVWSSHPDRRFKARLEDAGFDVEEVRVHATGGSGRRHVVWLAGRA